MPTEERVDDDPAKGGVGSVLKVTSVCHQLAIVHCKDVVSVFIHQVRIGSDTFLLTVEDVGP